MATISASTVVVVLWFLNVVRVALGSVISTGDFNKDFFVTWSPNHVYTSPDGHYRSLELDQASGILIIEIGNRVDFCLFNF